MWLSDKHLGTRWDSRFPVRWSGSIWTSPSQVKRGLSKRRNCVGAIDERGYRNTGWQKDGMFWEDFICVLFIFVFRAGWLATLLERGLVRYPLPHF